MKNCFRAPRLFLSRGDFERWAVPASDSHPEDREFWERVARKVGNAPSSLHCTLPDIYHSEEDAEGTAWYMYNVLAAERIERIGRGFMVTERTLKSGLVRTGIVAALDLEVFSYARGEITPARATEGPSPRAEELLPLRRKAVLEFPHTLLFYRDKKNKILRDIELADTETLYEFELMEEGGKMRGSFVPASDAYDIAEDMASRGEPCFAVADGHDEIIAAKMYWEEIKPTLKGAALRNHPARYALVECINLYDPAVELRPVHRFITDTDMAAFVDYFRKNIRCKQDGNMLLVDLPAGAEGTARVDEVISAYCKANGGEVHYSDDIAAFSQLEGAGVILKAMEKDDLFYDLKGGKLMPRHTFTIGEENKRFSLEGREISYD